MTAANRRRPKFSQPLCRFIGEYKPRFGAVYAHRALACRLFTAAAISYSAVERDRFQRSAGTSIFGRQVELIQETWAFGERSLEKLRSGLIVSVGPCRLPLQLRLRREVGIIHAKFRVGQNRSVVDLRAHLIGAAR